MTTAIDDQKRLMERAQKILRSIEINEELLEEAQKDQQAWMIPSLEFRIKAQRATYADIMTALVKNIFDHMGIKMIDKETFTDKMMKGDFNAAMKKFFQPTN